MANASRKRDDLVRYDIIDAGQISANLGSGYDVVEIGDEGGTVQQVRITFTSAEVGNDNANDSGTLTNQDGGLAVRVQAEDGASDTLVRGVDRFDDEGISFVSDGGFTFDVRDLVAGVSRGDGFSVVRLGTSGVDFYNERDTSTVATYINAGRGNDVVTTGTGDDFLVGGAGDDRLSGGAGDDSYIGGGGNDVIIDRGFNGDDTVFFNVLTDGSDSVDLGGGLDRVNVTTATGTTTQVRLTFTSAEVGDGGARESGTRANQDGDLAVRLQAEDGSDALTGLVSRFDDENVTFFGGAGVTFDVRDLPTGTARGVFDVVRLGGRAQDEISFAGRTQTYYVNAGEGNDRIVGGSSADFLVGGVGNDRINGGEGDDSLLGGAGFDLFRFEDGSDNDTIIDFQVGTDKIDLRPFNIAFSDLDFAGNVIGVDTNSDDIADFTITLANNAAVTQGDFFF